MKEGDVDSSRTFDATQVAALYAEFAEEDRLLSEEGMSEYGEGLHIEDMQ